MRMGEREGVRRVWVKPVSDRRSRGRRRIRWHDKLKDGLVEQDAFDRNSGRKHLKATDSKVQG